MHNNEKLLEKAKQLPKSAGCYLMKDKNDCIIYIGKAKSLKSRVKSYFDNSLKFTKTQYLVKNIYDFEFIITSNEIESLVLENNLIKRHSPKYNIRLKDDKTYPYLSINGNEDFPRLVYARKPKRSKGFSTYGPFPDGQKFSSVLKILTKSLRLRDCSMSEFKSRKTPCILHQMYQCDAPCVNLITKDEYSKQINKVIKFFKSNKGINDIINELESKMFEHSENEEYERAILLRNSIESIREYQEHTSKQEVQLSQDGKNIDVLGFYFGTEEIDLSIYKIRNSLLIGGHNINFFNTFESKEDFLEQAPSIISRYYEDQALPPDQIIMDLNIDKENLEFYFQEHLKKNIKVSDNHKDLKQIIQAAKEHAENSQRIRQENSDGLFKALSTLRDILKIQELPRHLECYDVAIWQGSSPTAAQIVFIDGKPDKTKYRYYHLKERPEGNNDFAMMEEVLERRLKTLPYPDVFIVDGGQGQVSSFIKVLEKRKINIPVVGIAKSKITQQARFSDLEIIKTQERLIIPHRKNPHILSRSPELFRIIVNMRDEAHRFSRKLHHKKEKSKFLTSELLNISGVGKTSYKKIMDKIDGPLEQLLKLSAKEIAIIYDIKTDVAQKILKFLDPKQPK